MNLSSHSQGRVWVQAQRKKAEAAAKEAFFRDALQEVTLFKSRTSAALLQAQEQLHSATLEAQVGCCSLDFSGAKCRLLDVPAVRLQAQFRAMERGLDEMYTGSYAEVGPVGGQGVSIRFCASVCCLHCLFQRWVP